MRKQGKKWNTERDTHRHRRARDREADSKNEWKWDRDDDENGMYNRANEKGRERYQRKWEEERRSMERARASPVHRTPRNMMKKVTMKAFSSVCVTRSKRVTTTPTTTEKEKKKKNSERSVSDTRSFHRTQSEHDIPPRVRS